MHRRIVLALLACAFGGCGGDDPAPARTAPVRVTPVPTAKAPPPSPTAEIHATDTPAPAATATATATATAEGGDEQGIRQAVQITVSAGRVQAEPATVTAFLPLAFRVRNTLPKPLTVVVMQAGDGDVIARIEVDGGGEANELGAPLKPGTAEILSPDLDPDATAILKVERAH